MAGPGSIVEFLDVVDALTDPPDPRDAFHLVIPSLPGYGFSSKPRLAGWGVERIAVAWAQLMDRLDYDRYGAQGGDWGSMITAALGSVIPEALVGIHLTMPMAFRPDPDDQPLSAAERKALIAGKAFMKAGTGYAHEQATRPQTLGYGLVDSPVALCTWIVEKFWDWSECAGDPCNAIRRDRLLDDVMLYWLPATGTSSIRLYWESYRRRRMDPVGGADGRHAVPGRDDPLPPALGGAAVHRPAVLVRAGGGRPLRLAGAAGGVRGRGPGVLPDGPVGEPGRVGVSRR